MTKVIERTSSTLDAPPQDKLYMRLHVFNACEHSWIMMIMGDSKMSKTEYDLKAICILCPWYTPKTVQYKGGGNYNIQQPRLPPNNAGRPVRQFKCPLAWLKWRTGSPLVRYCFLVILFSRQFMRGTQALTQGSDYNWNDFILTNNDMKWKYNIEILRLWTWNIIRVN